MFSKLAPVAKAIVPAALMMFWALIAPLGFVPDMTLESAVALLLASLGVYQIPNAKV